MSYFHSCQRGMTTHMESGFYHGDSRSRYHFNLFTQNCRGPGAGFANTSARSKTISKKQQRRLRAQKNKKKQRHKRNNIKNRKSDSTKSALVRVKYIYHWGMKDPVELFPLGTEATLTFENSTRLLLTLKRDEKSENYVLCDCVHSKRERKAPRGSGLADPGKQDLVFRMHSTTDEMSHLYKKCARVVVVLNDNKLRNQALAYF